MTLGWRITKLRYANPPEAAFDGEGARRRGGRWSSPGRRVAYASSSLALAALEYFVNLDPQDAPDHFVSVHVEIPDSIAIESIDETSLPGDWRSRPYPTRLNEFGDNWLSLGRSVWALVPSVVIPQERNLLVNPAHPDFQRLVFCAPVEFKFDRRMWK